MQYNEILAIALANRRFLYQYLWRAFASEADAELMGVVADAQTLEQVVMLAGADSPAVHAQEILMRFAEANADAPALLASEYTKLFIGPGKLPAPPWESVYVCGEDLLFQESTLAVREAYRAAGYQASGYPHEADDHLATELNFMATLAHDAQGACEQGDNERVRELLSRQLMFLAQHLNAWLPAFRERLHSSALSSLSAFYLSFVNLAVELCVADAFVIEELMGA